MECDKCNERFADGFIKGRKSAFRENKSGCSCIINDVNEIVIEICGAHRKLIEQVLKKGLK